MDDPKIYSQTFDILTIDDMFDEFREKGGQIPDEVRQKLLRDNGRYGGKSSTLVVASGSGIKRY